MEMLVNRTIGRRQMLAGLSLGGAMAALPGCATLPGFGLTEAIKRILTLSSQQAFATLTQDDGFWNSAVARIGLPSAFTQNASLVSALLSTGPVRNQLQKTFNNIAEDGAERAAPLVADAIRNISIGDAAAIVNGGGSAATSYLRGQMGTALIGAMVPALGDAMRVASNPLLGQALSALSGVDVNGVAQGLAVDVDNAIWAQIGASESAIRANPQATNDPAIIAVFGLR